ncbi:MAG: HDIG domain-containing protein [Thermoplasmata archaeon]
MLDEESAMAMVEKNVDNKNLVNHMLAVSKIMETLASEVDEDEKKWKILGLVHDVDYEETKDDPDRHALVSADMLIGKVPDDIVRAVKSHNFEQTGVEPDNTMEYALIAADAVSGLVVATALVMPNGKLEEARPESVIKKFSDSSFAKNIDRDKILYCEKLGLGRDEFLTLSLKTLQEIDDELGL